MEVTHIEQIWDLISLFPNVKRVIYAAQSLDFTGESIFDKTDIDFLKGYTNLSPKNINLKYSFYAYKYFLQCVERQWEWKELYMTNKKFSNLDFDHTGSAPLHIYGQDIIKKRWVNPWIQYTTEESYLALERIIKKTNYSNIIFYLAIQPYRAPLVENDKRLRNILTYFHSNTEKTVLKNGGKFLNLHNKLELNDNYFADRIHLNDKGAAITAEAIGKFIDTSE